jgi:ribonuclease HI
MFEFPQNGICVDAECRGNPGVSRFQLYDLSSKENKAISEPFHATNNIAEFLGLLNAIHYCLKNEIENLFSDSQTALSWARKRQYRTKQMPDLVLKRVDKGLEFLRKLEYNHENFSFTDLKTNKIVFLNKWLTSEWGENPADFGNKIK